MFVRKKLKRDGGFVEKRAKNKDENQGNKCLQNLWRLFGAVKCYGIWCMIEYVTVITFQNIWDHLLYYDDRKESIFEIKKGHLLEL